MWADGCFDLVHFGHANALRQAKSLGDYLVVGVHTDEEITKNKGCPPVMNEEERYEMVAAIKWVDEVAKGAPYVTSLEWMDKFGCDCCVHGDDLVTTADGKDTYAEVKQAGRFRTVPRTEGVSTTNLVGRMLLLTKEHHEPYNDDRAARSTIKSNAVVQMSEGNQPKSSPYTGVSQYMPSSKRIVQFSEGKDPTPTDKIVYIDGAFDLFHVGHVGILREAKKLGNYLLVGVLPDNVVNEKKGGGWPVMNLHERVLSVLSCRYVDEVIIGAPWTMTEDFIKSQRISVVVHGTVNDPAYVPQQDDPLEVARKLGILKTIVSPRKITTTEIVDRIIKNRQQYEERNKKKEAKEIQEIQGSKKDTTS